MPFTIDLEYTPLCPQDGLPFTESSFVRRSVPFTFEVAEIGVALVDLWNLGWDDGPVSETFGPDLNFERGRSHAMRKRQIIEDVIAPTTDALRNLGVQIFHCNHGRFLEPFPQWLTSTTEEERLAHWESIRPKDGDSSDDQQAQTKTADWQSQHHDLIHGTEEWGMKQYRDLYSKMAIPVPARPKENDLLVFAYDQFYRLLTERGIRVLFYMGFETDCCLLRSVYGIRKMTASDALCVVVRDGTTTIETAETLDGLWRTKAAIIDIEQQYGYSVSSGKLVEALYDR